MRDPVLTGEARLLSGERLEALGAGRFVIVSHSHGFGADALLLADFAAPRWGERALDLGTGCGILPLFWCREGKLAHATGMEIQQAVHDQFRRSILLNRLEGRLCAACGDLRDWRPSAAEKLFDLVTVNPPYFPLRAGAACAQEPFRVARQEAQCTLSDAVRAGARLTRFGGRFCLCHKPERLCDVMCEMRAQGLEPKRLRFVAQRLACAPWLFLLEGRRGGKPGLSVEPLFVVEEEPGIYSSEMRAIYEPGREEDN